MFERDVKREGYAACQADYAALGGSQIKGGTYNAYAGEPQRAPELPNQLDRLDGAVSGLFASFDQLEKRLANGSLRPEPPTCGNEQKLAAAPPVSGYANTVYAITSRLTALADRVRDVERRLEI